MLSQTARADAIGWAPRGALRRSTYTLFVLRCIIKTILYFISAWLRVALRALRLRNGLSCPKHDFVVVDGDDDPWVHHHYITGDVGHDHDHDRESRETFLFREESGGPGAAHARSL
ncbi:hypothetical protein EVAR_92724_1 [Eumeta japonica]|uniref:Uncharacterized protein n=1 Tax=Eumeta variegata TaxID=151549 RepID=A0A4C1SXX5_EUMVA|nr:hypothetical protein EVAR_92724_1 [Eumeta japonica]